MASKVENSISYMLRFSTTLLTPLITMFHALYETLLHAINIGTWKEYEAELQIEQRIMHGETIELLDDPMIALIPLKPIDESKHITRLQTILSTKILPVYSRFLSILVDFLRQIHHIPELHYDITVLNDMVGFPKVRAGVSMTRYGSAHNIFLIKTVVRMPVMYKVGEYVASFFPYNVPHILDYFYSSVVSLIHMLPMKKINSIRISHGTDILLRVNDKPNMYDLRVFIQFDTHICHDNTSVSMYNDVIGISSINAVGRDLYLERMFTRVHTAVETSGLYSYNTIQQLLCSIANNIFNVMNVTDKAYTLILTHYVIDMLHTIHLLTRMFS